MQTKNPSNWKGFESMCALSVFALKQPKSEEHIEQSQTSGSEEHTGQELLSRGEEQHGHGDQEIDHEEEDKGVYSLVHFDCLITKVHFL